MSDTSRPAATQASKWASSSKEHTAKKCIFVFEQINRNHDLTPAEKCVAIEIAGRINWKTGCWDIGTRRLAADTGLRQQTVVDAVKRLAALGHLGVIPGRGRGNISRYWLVLKKTEANKRNGERFISEAKRNGTAPIKETDTVSTHYNHTSAPNGARTSRVEREADEAVASRPHPRIITGDSDWDSIPDTNEDDNCFRTNDDFQVSPSIASVLPRHQNGNRVTFSSS
jgi:hypothetical protein